jgi:hypothetical protein
MKIIQSIVTILTLPAILICLGRINQSIGDSHVELTVSHVIMLCEPYGDTNLNAFLDYSITNPPNSFIGVQEK